ncbi:hypothetical protein HII36_01490 [Nonomuraea sp. NN258]|uniref:hypothetical protein n=1 Tax=Nonomuraea antri TaxID=2730852 RepID=UPI00156A311B|nr:hypothetical protein [Nonomuraea antri]NRQ30519.1 hypothetical protein [Nonomuraea antri]
MSGIATTVTGFRYPYVIGWSGEVQQHRLRWELRRDGERLAYAESRPSDYVYGVLRLRQGQKRTGKPDFTTVNTRRQWRCMDKRLCQVCAGSAVDPETGRIWWLLSSCEGEAGDGFTNAPPTCRVCIPEAISQCSHLRRNAAVFTVGACYPHGVRGDVFLPYLPPVVPFRSNAVVRFADEEIAYCVARELLVRLHDVQPAVTDGDAR